MANITTEQRLKEILAANDKNSLRERFSNWQPVYNRRADLFEAGEKYPTGTFFFPIENTGFMLRIDRENHIYGFAIENTRFFLKENPQFLVPLSYFVYPWTFYLWYLPNLFMAYQVQKASEKIGAVFSDYVAARSVFAV